MSVISIRWRGVWLFLAAIFALLLYNEFIVYYVVLLQCRWPDVTSDLGVAGKGRGEAPLKVMLLSDPHLLGPREGHWFDKLRREWHMQRTFQSAMLLFNPEVIFVLGDLFDEGKWSTESEFQYFVARFRRLFQHGARSDLRVVVGNHDIGFHFSIDHSIRKRFTKTFDAPSVRLVTVRGVSFVLLNSMAFEGDHCDMCGEAERQLDAIVKSLDCAEGRLLPQYCTSEEKLTYTRPVILQHFPMFRKSDHNCSGDDASPPDKKDTAFRPRYDCLSEQASDKILQWLRPRLIFTGHTHAFCQTDHPGHVAEWTLASFSWRNRNNPSFLLAEISDTGHAINKCFHPQEDTVIYTYIVGVILILGWFIFPRNFLSNYRITNKIN